MSSRPLHNATVLGEIKKWPALKTAAEAAAAIGIDEQRLLDLADAQLAPHWRVDGGPPQFVFTELRNWAQQELLQRYDGKAIPTDFTIVFEGGKTNPHSIPRGIQDLEGLRDVTELLQLRSGIYFLCEQGQVVYIGQSVRLGSRVNTHRSDGKDFDRIFFLPWPRFDLNRLEAALIKILHPPLNNTFTTVEPTDADRELIKSLLVNGTATAIIPRAKSQNAPIKSEIPAPPPQQIQDTVQNHFD